MAIVLSEQTWTNWHEIEQFWGNVFRFRSSTATNCEKPLEVPPFYFTTDKNLMDGVHELILLKIYKITGFVEYVKTTHATNQYKVIDYNLEIMPPAVPSQDYIPNDYDAHRKNTNRPSSPKDPIYLGHPTQVGRASLVSNLQTKLILSRKDRWRVLVGKPVILTQKLYSYEPINLWGNEYFTSVPKVKVIMSKAKFWEIIHNLIAHPLLIFNNRKDSIPGRFHDYTASKMTNHENNS